MKNNFWLTKICNDDLTEYAEDIRLSEILNENNSILRTTIDIMTPTNISIDAEVLETPLVYPVFESKCTFEWDEEKSQLISSNDSYVASSWAKRGGVVKLRAEADDLSSKAWELLENSACAKTNLRQKFTAIIWYDKIHFDGTESWEEIHTLQKAYIYGYKCHMYPEPNYVDMWLKYDTMKANPSQLAKATGQGQGVKISDPDLT